MGARQGGEKGEILMTIMEAYTAFAHGVLWHCEVLVRVLGR